MNMINKHTIFYSSKSKWFRENVRICAGCMFALTDDDNDCYHLECCRSERADENDVIYKKVER